MNRPLFSLTSIILCFLLSGCKEATLSAPKATLTVGLIAASVTIIGWFVIELVRRYNDARKSKVTEQIGYVQKQIEEFYGPLFNLVNQISICNQVLTQINVSKRNETEREAITNYFQANYFLPLHIEFNAVLKGKLYLVNGSRLPDSIYQYLRHAIQEQVQLGLWREKRIDTSDVRGYPYPVQLYTDLKAGLDQAMLKYDKLTSVLDKGLKLPEEPDNISYEA